MEWIYTDSPVYFLTACTARRRSILADAEVHEAFLLFCRTAEEKGVWVGRYVLMPDHLHLFAAFAPNAPSLSAWMKAFKGAISESLYKRGFRSPFWQKGFFDHVLRSAESYGQKWQYVLDNPVRKGLVAKPDDWPYQGEVHPLAI